MKIINDFKMKSRCGIGVPVLKQNLVRQTMVLPQSDDQFLLRGFRSGHPADTDPAGHQCQKKCVASIPANMPMNQIDSGNCDPIS